MSKVWNLDEGFCITDSISLTNLLHSISKSCNVFLLKSIVLTNEEIFMSIQQYCHWALRQVIENDIELQFANETKDRMLEGLQDKE
jgi:hypothetical protein